MFDKFQITFDAHDAPSLAEFWALALDYILQPPPEGFESWDAFADSIDMSQEERHAISAIVDSSAAGPRILFLNVPEGKTVKNRVHLDVQVAAGLGDAEHDRVRDAKVEQLIEAGATYVDTRSDYGPAWVVMQDPEGNEFCVA